MKKFQVYQILDVFQIKQMVNFLLIQIKKNMQLQSNFLIKNAFQSNYNWIGVLQFLQGQYQKTNDRQNTWLLQKKTMQTRINQLEGQLKACDLITKDLMKRNKMLEFSLRQERIKNGSKTQLEQINPQIPNIPKRKPKSNKATLSKILTSLGIKDIFEEIERQVNLTVPQKSIIKQIDFEKQIKMINNNDQKKITPIESVVYKNSVTLEGHTDGVRDLFFHPTKPILATVSQDCLIKLWNTNQLSNTLNPYLNIREHSGPIFTITGDDDYIFTGGMEGIIRCWSFPTKDQLESNGKYLKGSWQNAQQEKLQPVWQLLYNSSDKTVFSTSSDSTIKMYSIQQKIVNSKVVQVSSKLKQSYNYRYQNLHKFSEQDIPTTICLIDHNPKVIVAGFVNNHAIVMFDKQTAKVSNVLKYSASGQVSTNKIISYPNFLVSAHEDKFIRIFDNNRMTYSFQAHNDSVVSLAMAANKNEFFSCSHDGFVKLWDIRKYESIMQLSVHTKKYDEAIHCISNHPTQCMAASGGADSLVKIYVPQI